MEASFRELVQQGIDPGNEARAFGSDQEPHRSDDPETHPLRQVAGLEVIEDDSPPTLHSQRDGLGLAVVDRYLERLDEVGIGRLFNLQPFRRGPEFALDFRGSMYRLEQMGQEIEVADVLQADQAGAVDDDGLLQESTSLRNSSGL